MKFRWFLLLLLALLTLLVITCKKDEDEDNTGSITLTAPNGGENWAAGSTHSITWTDNGLANVALSYSVDGGSQWQSIIASAANNHTYGWSVPNSVSTTCRVRVADAADAAVNDVSDGNFAITTAAPGDNASGGVQTGQGGTITTPNGAQIIVPPGAVPAMEDGSPATIVFSIEEAMDVTPNPPTEETIASSVYRFGPEGFVFSQPVEIAIPVPTPPDTAAGNGLALYRINPTTQTIENFGGTYDASTQTIRARTYVLSPWFATSTTPTSTGWGCAHVTNVSALWWLSLCVNEYTLEYPEIDGPLIPADGLSSFWSPVGHIGVSSEGNWLLPQGTFNVCVGWSENGTFNNVHNIEESVVVVSSPRDWASSICNGPDLWFSGPATTDSGYCNCVPTPSVPVGTGAIQVSLTWYVNDLDGVDLDLHLYEPDSTHIYFGNPQSPSGGTLDRDDTCGDFTNGTTENIYYTSNPPIGQYIVKVHYWGDCGEDNHPTQAFSVRTVVQGNTQTFNGSVAPGEMIEITRFNVSGAGPAVFLPIDETVQIVASTPAK